MPEANFKPSIRFVTQRKTKMKKLMVAASVAICAAAGFALESANVVG